MAFPQQSPPFPIAQFTVETYGRAGIPQYWIVNLVDRCIEVYTHPSETAEHGYADRDVVHSGDLEVTLDGRQAGRIPITSILP